MQGVNIINLETVKEDNRGKIFQFENRNSSKLLLIKRNKGSISGGHYHTGKNSMKDPETLVFIEGEAQIIQRNVRTKEELTIRQKEPAMFKLDPYIYHKIIALTDIIMMDMNSIKDDNDTIKGDELIE